MFEQVFSIILEFFQFISIIIRTLPRDIRGVFKLIRHSLIIKYHVLCRRDFIGIFRQNVQRYGSKPCFILEETVLTFQQVNFTQPQAFEEMISFS